MDFWSTIQLTSINCGDLFVNGGVNLVEQMREMECLASKDLPMGSIIFVPDSMHSESVTQGMNKSGSLENDLSLAN